MEYVGLDGPAVAFQPDDHLEYPDSKGFRHTVLEQQEGWVLLPKGPFPVKVWLDAGQQHAVVDAGDDVYRWGEESIVILKVHQAGVLAREELPEDTLCEDEVKPTPEDKIRKFSIPWKDLTDKNGHLRLQKKYTMC